MNFLYHLTFIFFLLFSYGCSENENKILEPETIRCQRTKLEKQFIVHWKNKESTLLHTQQDDDISQFIKLNDPKILFIEPNYLLARDAQPVNAAFNVVARPASGVHDLIQTEFMWRRGFLGQNIVVAVIDTGINLNHPQLRNHLAVNEIESMFQRNGIDDDANGFVDDIFGWNFVNNQTESIDEHGHGTAMAGIITGSTNRRPSLSMAPLAKILAVDFMNETGGTEFHAQQAMAYAISRKVHIINNSWSINCSELLKQAFLTWKNENVIFVNAAGNSPIDVVLNEIVPSSLDLPNSINVGSLDEFGNKSTYSGYGLTVKIFAPGEFIPTIYPSSGLNLSVATSGTSVSAAIVSGAAALLWSAFPEASAVQIVGLLTVSANQEPASQQVLDLKKAMNLGNNLFHRDRY